jgi:hypothetical protein
MLMAVLVVAAPAWADLPANVTRQAEGGGVTVSATPLPGQDAGTRIRVSLSTHSVNLDNYRFETIAKLRDKSGRQYPLEAVEQTSGGGHHRDAVLRFAKVPADAGGVELVVRDVAGVAERVLRWDAQ